MTEILALAAAMVAWRSVAYMAYLRRRPAIGLHEWVPYRRDWGPLEFRTRVRCRRCRVTRPEDEVGVLPPDCESTKDFLLVKDVMES